ncbi:MAG: outer membrane protein transport protein [Bacteroidetes bacterium]|nr:outer membrane protein transport protein [Bacteroidota bacterium]
MKLIIKILSIILFVSQIVIYGQNGSSYSRIGIGDILYSYSASELAIGQLGSSLTYSSSINIVNPASWTGINRTRFETSISYSGLYISDNNSKQFNGKAQFSGFTLAFPISDSNGIGLALGLVPYSMVSYKVLGNENYLPATNDSYQVTYQGQGGLSKTFIGASYKLPFDLNIGASLEYYFGSLDYTSNASFTNTSDISTLYKRSYQPNGLGTTFGIITPDLSKLFHSQSVSNLRLGLSLNYISTLSTDTLLTSTSAVRTDTIGEGTTQMKIPLRLTAGLSFALDQKYIFSFDAATQAWSQYSFNGIQSSDLRNALKLSAGFEFRPKVDIGTTAWEQIIWRAGFSYEQTQYQINNVGINQFSVSGGFSYPLSYANTLDIAVQYSTRGTKQSGLIKENMFKLNFGLSLGELWFLRHEE